MTFEELKKKLEKYNQEHLLCFYDTIPEEKRAALLQQIEETDFSVVTRIGKKEAAKKESSISPIAAMTLEEINADKEGFTETGMEAIRSGKVGAVLLAGGMGTRLGSDNPKGMYDIGITKPVYIFGRIIRPEHGFTCLL